jgi:hypothetical protein
MRTDAARATARHVRFRHTSRAFSPLASVSRAFSTLAALSHVPSPPSLLYHLTYVPYAPLAGSGRLRTSRIVEPTSHELRIVDQRRATNILTHGALDNLRHVAVSSSGRGDALLLLPLPQPQPLPLPLPLLLLLLPLPLPLLPLPLPLPLLPLLLLLTRRFDPCLAVCSAAHPRRVRPSHLVVISALKLRLHAWCRRDGGRHQTRSLDGARCAPNTLHPTPSTQHPPSTALHPSPSTHHPPRTTHHPSPIILPPITRHPRPIMKIGSIERASVCTC